ncbi:hypothetical protein RI196_09955 [Aeribacillus composti]|uniref:Phage-related protein n=1 Tax=Aeribacillus composti TaxID=1868734 RepID=A0ABY9W810_9BACI|nr:hypothetical protein [Aeribacillus composti]WNF31634.1 hypothetical protein RI196_09955 [Aeribacillus composti]
MSQNLIIRGGADFSGIKKEMVKTQEQLKNFQTSVSNTVQKVGAVLGAISFGVLARDSINMAKDVEASLGQIQRLMGSSADEFLNWANTQAKAFNMSKAEAYKYGSIFSNLISTFAQDTAQTAQYTQKLLEAAAVVASGTGRTMEDTLDRIRSGLLGNTEAIEDLGINVNIAMIESTRAFQQFANGRSWDQLDFQTQQLIRYFAILEQASTKFGDTVANNTATRLAQFNATLSNIKLNIGNALLPVLNAVLPALSAFAAKVEAITAKIALFFQALFGKGAVKQAKVQSQAVKQQSSTVSSLGGAFGGASKAAEKVAKATGKAAKATEKLAKARKKAYTQLAGFDEINNIKTSTAADSGGSGSGGSGSAGGGGGGGGATTVSAPVLDTSGFDNSVGKIPKRIQEMANKVRAIFSNLKNFIKKNKDEIVATLAGLAAAFLTYKLITNWTKMTMGLKKAFGALKLAFLGISLPALAVAAVVGLLVGALVYLWRTNENFRNKVIKIWEAIKSAVGKAIAAVVDFVREMISKIHNFWKENGAMILQAAQNIFDGIVAVIKFIMPVILAIVKSIWENVKGLISGALDVILGLIEFFAALFTGNFSEMWEGAKRVFKGAVKAIWNLMNLMLFGKIFGGIKILVTKGIGRFKTFANGGKKVFETFSNAIGKIVNGAYNILKSIATGIYNTFIKPIGNWLNNNLKPVFNSVFNSVKNIVNNAWNTLKTVASNINNNFVKPIVDWLKNNLKSAFDTVFNAVKSIVNSAWNTMKTIASYIFNNFVKPIGEWLKNNLKPAFETVFNGVKTVVNSAWNTMKTVASYIFNNFVKPVGNWLNNNLKPAFSTVFSGVKTVVSSAWNTIKSVGSNIYNGFIKPVANWLNKNLKPAFSTVFNGVKSVVSSAWNTIRNIAGWIRERLGGVVSYVSGSFKSGWNKAWNSVKSIFSKVFNSLWGIAKKPINLIIDGINILIRGLNKFKIDIPDWLAKLTGVKGGKFGFNIPTIPRLAQGGYVRANNPMLAIIGDNRTEGEIVAPESKIYEQTFRAVTDALRQNGGGNLELTINLGSTRIFHEIIRGINTAQRQAGKTLLNV